MRALKATLKSMKETWQDLASAYLRGRPTLMRVCLLIDSRHGVKDSDRETMKNLDRAAVTYRLVLTKTDQLKAASRLAVKVVLSSPAAPPSVHAGTGNITHQTCGFEDESPEDQKS